MTKRLGDYETSDPLVSSFRVEREIFVIRGQVVDVWKSQTGNLPSRTLRALPYLYSAALLMIMRRTTISHFSFLISHSGEAFKRNQEVARPIV